MIKIIRTNSKHSDFANLVKELDAYLKITDGDEHDFYNQFNAIKSLNHVVLVFKNDTAIGCGAFKPYDKKSVEIKRMFVNSDAREFGVGRQILSALENWAKEIGYASCVLETGKRQTEAVAFYKKCNYKNIPKYGQYQNMDNSLCFKKELS